MQTVGEVHVAQGDTQVEQTGVPVVTFELLFTYSPDWQDAMQVLVVVSRMGVELLWLHSVQLVAI